jgi:hypothetical protein
MCENNIHTKKVLMSEPLKYKPNVLYLEKNLNETQSVKNFNKHDTNHVLSTTFRSSSSKSVNKHHRSSPPQARHSHKKSQYRRSSSMYPPFEYLTNNLNYNYMINYENSKCGGGDDGSGSNSSSSGSGTTTNSPSYSIANDDIEIFNRLNREDLMVDHFRWLSEKPLSVLQLDPADRAVLKIAGKTEMLC